MIGDLFEEVRILVEGLAADFNIHREIRTDIERWVDVDEFEASGVLDLAAEPARIERGVDELVVTPDEFVRPALDLPSAGIEAEFASVAFFLPGFVDMCSRIWRGRMAVQTSRGIKIRSCGRLGVGYWLMPFKLQLESCKTI